MKSNITLKEITIENLENMVPDRIFWRGEDLYSEGTVRNVNISDNLITAEVRGRRLYRVEAEVSEDDLMFSCTCPYEGFCKHRVALGLWIIDNKTKLSEVIKIQEKHADRPDVTAFVEKATREQKDEFLIEALNESPTLLTRFEVMIKGALNLGDDIDMDYLVDEIKGRLETFDLEDYSRFYDSATERYGYRKQWQVLQEGAESEFEDLLNQYKVKALELLEVRDVIGAFKYILALYEALKRADFEHIDDPACIFEAEELYSLAEAYLDQSLKEFISGFEAISFEENVYLHLMDIFFNRLSANANDRVYRIRDFTGLLLNCVVNEKAALHMENLLQRATDLKEEEYCELMLAVYDKKNESNKWLDIAAKYYKSNEAVAEKLLNQFIHQKAKLVELAKDIAFTFNKKFIPFFYENLEKEDDPGLYKRILAEHTKEKQTIELYREYKNKYGDEAAMKFINGLEGDWSVERFYIQLLKEEKAYAKLLSLAQANSSSTPALEWLRPIVHVYPDQVFRIISVQTKRFLNDNIGRNYYRQATEWLKLLKHINDERVREKTTSFINHLLEEYRNRPALKDELRKGGLFQ